MSRNIEEEKKLTNIEKELLIEEEDLQEILSPLDINGSCDSSLQHRIIRRKDYLLDRWTHINIQRSQRPITASNLPDIEKKDKCIFCYGNEDKTPRFVKTGKDYRIGQELWALRIFPNLYPWLLNHINIVETGLHKIFSFEISEDEEILFFKECAKQCLELEGNGYYPMLFKNQGWGASISHFHWQLGGIKRIPRQIIFELEKSKEFFNRFNKNIFDAIIEIEKDKNERFIYENDFLSVIAPFAPRTNFEIWLISKENVSSLSMASSGLLEAFGRVYSKIMKILETKGFVKSSNTICHQLSSVSYYRLHLEIMPFKYLAGAERGFDEYAIEVLPEKVASIIKDEI